MEFLQAKGLKAKRKALSDGKQRREENKAYQEYKKENPDRVPWDRQEEAKLDKKADKQYSNYLKKQAIKDKIEDEKDEIANKMAEKEAKKEWEAYLNEDDDSFKKRLEVPLEVKKKTEKVSKESAAKEEKGPEQNKDDKMEKRLDKEDTFEYDDFDDDVFDK